MSATKLLSNLTRLGIQLEAHGDRLRYYPRSALTPVLLARLKAHKADLLAILGRNLAEQSRPTIYGGACPHDAGTVMRATVQGDRPFCPLCGRRVGFDAPYPWA